MGRIGFNLIDLPVKAFDIGVDKDPIEKCNPTDSQLLFKS